MNRHDAVSLLDGMKKDWTKVCSIEPVIKDTIPDGGSTNTIEILLGNKLDSYGFPPFQRGCCTNDQYHAGSQMIDLYPLSYQPK